ncbi:NAPDH-dependent diflavin reductase [Aspergillus nanangensis]|uniref:NADPH-dependent diflavin oxidoreductase 1 n=1 Tax=Aspergillus nanangensis TaxID=2582783 RepID=A0AAD4CQR8_ASPNN|nr:NAPDH-dependent diflavin reductase [Aspergillus nanangensis]
MAESQTSRSQKRSALILYGSETGNAQEVAEELGALAERLRFVTHVSAMDHFQLETLKSYTIVIFALSTTGQGDLPANARTFWRSMLLKKLPPTFLSGVNFTTFGLGDTSYPKFNWAARKLYKRLLQLGANEIYPCGEADQQHDEGLEGTFIPWLTGFRKHLLESYPLPPGQHPIPDDVQLPPKWILQLRDQDSSAETEHSVPGTHEQTASGEFPRLSRLDHDFRPIPDTLTATLVENKRVTPAKHWQDVRHITLTVPDVVDYVPGDMVSITPKNFMDDVDSLIKMMGWDEHADKVLSLVPNKSQYAAEDVHAPPIPSLESYPKLTLRALLTDYLDIRAIPRRAFFSSVAHYTADEMHKERLLEFTNPEFVDEFWDYTTRPRRSILEVLHEFDSVKIPWQHAAAIFPVMRGRQFSIASGGELKRTAEGGARFELLIAIVKYRTVIRRIREGVCTKYMAALHTGSTLRVQLQRGGLNSSVAQLTGPTVLVGPGTGVAPLRSMLWEKAEIVKNHNAQNPGKELAIGPTILVYGGRNRASDYFFEDDWKTLSSLVKLQVLTAFSRDQEHKLYVQNAIRDNAKLFYNILHELSGSVYVCGSSGRMPEAVRDAIVEAFQHGADNEEDQFEKDEADEYLLEMEKIGRYKQETW